MTLFNDLGIAKKLGFGFGLCVVLTGIVSVKAVSGMSALGQSLASVVEKSGAANNSCDDVNINAANFQVRAQAFVAKF